jgi:hypothetical protein
MFYSWVLRYKASIFFALRDEDDDIFHDAAYQHLLV